jgi:hypothetical protein
LLLLPPVAFLFFSYCASTASNVLIELKFKLKNHL